MTQLLYIPGFQEEKTGRPVGPIISKYCDENCIDFHTIDLPGDTDSNPNTGQEFSLTALKEEIKAKIITVLETDPVDDLTIVAYSLSARPTIDAISELSKEYKSRINLNLLHPAYNPLHAIKAMGAIRDEGGFTLQPNEFYLNGDVDDVFDPLILDWLGNGKEFQEDLLRYHSDGIYSYEDFLDYISDLDFNVQVMGNDNSKDDVIHDNGVVKYTKRTAMKHLPKKLEEELKKVFNTQFYPRP